MEARVLTAHVPLPMAVKIDEYADRLQRSRGWIVKQALAEWMSRQESGMAVQATGFAEAQAGFGAAAAPAVARAVETLKALRQNTTLGDISWQELRDAGRR
ncbi:MAG: ribbon-helix-helix domain-containing protein [Acidocella sp.]|nr:ribbon-helix-helix domain-containing protein [Acidocella sp.]